MFTAIRDVNSQVNLLHKKQISRKEFFKYFHNERKGKVKRGFINHQREQGGKKS